MIGIDTNILVRYFTSDDSIQAKKSAKILEIDSSKVNFADCLIGRSYELSGCDFTLSFDKAAIKDLAYFKEI